MLNFIFFYFSIFLPCECVVISGPHGRLGILDPEVIKYLFVIALCLCEVILLYIF